MKQKTISTSNILYIAILGLIIIIILFLFFILKFTTMIVNPRNGNEIGISEWPEYPNLSENPVLWD